MGKRKQLPVAHSQNFGDSPDIYFAFLFGSCSQSGWWFGQSDTKVAGAAQKRSLLIELSAGHDSLECSGGGTSFQFPGNFILQPVIEMSLEILRPTCPIEKPDDSLKVAIISLIAAAAEPLKCLKFLVVVECVVLLPGNQQWQNGKESVIQIPS